MTSGNGRKEADEVAQQATLVKRLVAPKVTKYYSVGLSVTGPIKRLLKNTIESTNECLKNSNELLNSCAENSTPKGDAELDALEEHRTSLKKALIELQSLPLYVESRLEIPKFLQEPETDTISIEMRKLLAEADVDHKMSTVRSTIGRIEIELVAKRRVFSLEAIEYDPFKESFKKAEDMSEEEIENALLKNSKEENQAIAAELEKELREIELLKEQQEKEMTAAQRNDRLLAEKLEEDKHRHNSSQQNFSSEESDNNRKELTYIPNPSETDILRKPHHSFQVLEQKNTIVISQSIDAAITKITEGISESLYIPDNQRQERRLHFHEEENRSVFDGDLTDQYMNMGQIDQIGAYQMPPNNHSTPQNSQGFNQNMPQSILSSQKGERCYRRSEENMYNQSQNYRKFDRYERRLTMFDGTGRLGNFRRVFYEYVVENPNLTNDDKFIELARHLNGPAAKCLQNLENTEEAVHQTFHELEQVYGQKIDRMDLHEKLVALPFHQTDCDRMSRDLQAHRTIIYLLKEKNLDVDDERTILPFCQKLPESIMDEIMPIVEMESEKLTFIMVHDAVMAAIKTLKRKNTLSSSNTAMHISEQHHSYPKGFNNSHQVQRYNNSYQNQQYNYQGIHQGGNSTMNNNYGSGTSEGEGSEKTLFRSHQKFSQ